MVQRSIRTVVSKRDLTEHNSSPIKGLTVNLSRTLQLVKDDIQVEVLWDSIYIDVKDIMLADYDRIKSSVNRR